MILTNTLLSIGFSVASNFASVVPMPMDVQPMRIEDLKQYVIGSPLWPADLLLVHRRGTVMRVQRGVICFFQSPFSFTGHQDPKLRSQFRGKASLTEDQVLDVAEKTVRRLARRGDPILGLRARVVRLRESSQGPEVPFYEISWPNPERDGDSPAWMEIDARDGSIVKVHLLDRAFYDLARSWEIRRQVCVPDAAKAVQGIGQKMSKTEAPCPSTNQVVSVLSSWRQLCQGLDKEPGDCINLAAVDWYNTCLYTNPWIATTVAVCRITFTNGAWLEGVNGTVCNSFSAGACYVNDWNMRSPEEWYLFEGKIKHRWDKLATDLERNLVQKLQLPEVIVNSYGRELKNTKPPQLGSTGLNRVLVHWTNGLPQKVEYVNGAAWAWQNHLGFSAEFDVETGELESIQFRDPKLIEALGRAQFKAGRN